MRQIFDNSIIRTLTALVCLASFSWSCQDEGHEPKIAFISSLITLIALYVKKSNPSNEDKDNDEQTPPKSNLSNNNNSINTNLHLNGSNNNITLNPHVGNSDSIQKFSSSQVVEKISALRIDFLQAKNRHDLNKVAFAISEFKKSYPSFELEELEKLVKISIKNTIAILLIINLLHIGIEINIESKLNIESPSILTSLILILIALWSSIVLVINISEDK